MTHGGSSISEVQQLVMDELTPGGTELDPVRAWAHSHSGLRAAEILTTPTSSALLVARLV